MKRQNNTRVRVLIEDLLFDFTYTSNERKTIAPRILSGFKPGSDKRHLEVVFNPPLNKREASLSNIRILHAPSKQSNCCVTINPKTQSKNVAISDDETLHYISFPSHAIQLDPNTGKILLLYISLQNVQMNGSENSPPIYEPMWSISHERYKGLPFFPPDSKLNFRAEIDASIVPQSNPLWFKLKGEVTGSSISELLGFFVPKLGTLEAADYQLDGKKTFTGWKAVGVRFGNVSEHVLTLSLLDHCPDITIEECGYYQHPENYKWGASPDALIFDPNVEYPEDFKFEQDSRGVVEFKSSRWNCNFSGYYIPQCIWEMICTNTGFCDLIRYGQYRANINGKWVQKNECKKARLFRDPELDQKITQMIAKSLEVKSSGNREAFMRLVWTKPYVELRGQFDEQAKLATETHYSDVPIADTLVGEMFEQRNARNVANNEPDADDLIHRIDNRQIEIFRLCQEPDKKRRKVLVETVAKQIKDYTKLLL